MNSVLNKLKIDYENFKQINNDLTDENNSLKLELKQKW